MVLGTALFQRGKSRKQWRVVRPPPRGEQPVKKELKPTSFSLEEDRFSFCLTRGIDTLGVPKLIWLCLFARLSVSQVLNQQPEVSVRELMWGVWV